MRDKRQGRKAFQALFPDERKYSEIRFQLGDWTKHHKFTTWVYDMWRLWLELSRGETLALIELFPDFAKRLSSVDNDLLQLVCNHQQEILKRINELEARGVSTQAVTTGKSMSIGKIAMPTFDDEDTVVVNQDLTNDPAKNFLASFSSLGGDNGSTKES